MILILQKLNINTHEWFKLHLNCPPWLENFLNISTLKWPKLLLNCPTWLEKILNISTHKLFKLHLKCPPWLEKFLKISTLKCRSTMERTSIRLGEQYWQVLYHRSLNNWKKEQWKTTKTRDWKWRCCPEFQDFSKRNSRTFAKKVPGLFQDFCQISQLSRTLFQD